MARATIREVAREAGVSISSVSRFLSGEVRYRPATEDRISQAARRLGYQAHTAARLLRQTSTNLVGIAVRAALMVDPVVVALVVHAQRELEDRGFQPLLIEPQQMAPVTRSTSFPSPELLRGILSADFSLEESVPHFYASLREKLPIVTMYLVASQMVDCVTTDRKAGIAMAVEHLATLGHRRIAFAGAFEDSISQKPKLLGWRSAQRKFDLAMHPELEIHIPRRLGMAERGEFVGARLLELAPRPTAVVCSADIIALHLLRYLAGRAIKVPHDLSVVAFDGHSGGETSWPPLTTVAHPAQSIARAAVARLVQVQEMKAAERPWTPMTKLLKPTLMVRESTMHAQSNYRSKRIEQCLQ